jgi:putative aldouronate transport system permease protein
VLPLSKPILAVITLLTAVGIWNSYYYALIFLNSDTLYPLQLVLREIVVSTVPMMLFYPLVRRHFVKGVMLGSLKE